ncbi:MAG: hypothetical protein KDJ27_04120 [Gammaproteobacteria bacterium]|nr:hypothetical protein [Gammaproteobacteria bacterium]
MADEIKQADNIARVQPMNPSRSAGQRNRPRKKVDKERDDTQPRRHDGDGNHRVDEYV